MCGVIGVGRGAGARGYAVGWLLGVRGGPITPVAAGAVLGAAAGAAVPVSGRPKSAQACNTALSRFFASHSRTPKLASRDRFSRSTRANPGGSWGNQPRSVSYTHLTLPTSALG